MVLLLSYFHLGILTTPLTCYAVHVIYGIMASKGEAVQVPIAETIRTVLHALKRLGHDLIIEGSEGDDEDSGATIVESD